MRDYRYTNTGIEVGADLTTRKLVLNAQRLAHTAPSHLPARRRIAPGTKAPQMMHARSPLTHNPFAQHYGHVNGFSFSDVGDAVKSAVKSTGKAVKTAAKTVEHVANKPAALIQNAALKIAPDAIDPFIKQLVPAKAVSIPTNLKELKAEYNEKLPAAQMVLRNCGPWGMAASGALGAIGAAINGGSPEEIAWAAAEGASPTYVLIAIQAAKAAREGGSLRDMAVSTAFKAAKAYANNPAADSGLAAAETLIKGGSVTDAGINAAREQVKKQGPQALAAFDTAVKAGKGALAGKSAKDIALGAALDLGAHYFEPGSNAAIGYDAAAALIKGGKLTDVAIKQAKSKLSPTQQIGFDVAIGTIARIAEGTAKGQPSKLTTLGKAALTTAVKSAAGNNAVKLPPAAIKLVSINKLPVKKLSSDAKKLFNAATPKVALLTKPKPAVAAKTVSKPVAASVASRPKPLGPQPKLAGTAKGTLITSDGKKTKGSFKVAASGKSGTPGLLVLADGRIVRELFTKA